MEKLIGFLYNCGNEGPVHCYLGVEAILPLFRFQSQSPSQSHLPRPKLDRLLPERTALTHERSQQF